MRIRHVLWTSALPLIAACGSVEGDPSQDVASTASAVSVAKCNKVRPKDPLIAQLVEDSWRTQYPLTRLSVDANGNVTGVALPDALAGDLDLLNAIPEARASLARAVSAIAGLPDYGMAGMDSYSDACSNVPAWTPTGTTSIQTLAFEVHPDGANAGSWRSVHKAFAQECPLLKSSGFKDIVDPPGDGSTDAPPSTTVSATGVRANAYGLCPTGTAPQTFCKLSYATGVNFTGRSCQPYSGMLRCLLY